MNPTTDAAKAPTDAAKPATPPTTPGQPTGISSVGKGAEPAAAKAPPAEGGKADAVPPTTPASPTKAEDVKKEPAKADSPKGTETAEPFVKIPDGVETDKALLEKAVPLFKELGLKSADAQKVVDLYVGAQSLEVERNRQALAEQDRAWVDEVKGDKELGGEHLEANVRKARAAMMQFSPGLPAELDRFGLGNWPALLRAFHNIAKGMGNDSIAGATGGKAAAPQLSSDEALARSLYPSMHPKE